MLFFLYHFYHEHSLLKQITRTLSPKINVKNIKKKHIEFTFASDGTCNIGTKLCLMISNNTKQTSVFSSNSRLSSSRVLSPVHTMKLLSATQCCRQKFHRVYIRETCFKRFFMAHETVSSNRALLYILKLVCNISRLLANHSSAISEGQFTCNSYKCVYTIKKGLRYLQIHSKKFFKLFGSSFRRSSNKAW